MRGIQGRVVSRLLCSALNLSVRSLILVLLLLRLDKRLHLQLTEAALRLAQGYLAAEIEVYAFVYYLKRSSGRALFILIYHGLTSARQVGAKTKRPGKRLARCYYVGSPAILSDL